MPKPTLTPTSTRRSRRLKAQLAHLRRQWYAALFREALKAKAGSIIQPPSSTL